MHNEGQKHSFPSLDIFQTNGIDWSRLQLQELQINKTFEEVKVISKRKLSNIVKISVEKIALSYLTAIQKQKQKKET